MGKRVLICGGRCFDNKDLFNLHMSKFHRENKIDLIIQGGARGADYLAKRWAETAHLPMKEYPANWDVYGKQAGLIRNQEMLTDGKPDIVLSFPGGTGTADMVRRAEKAGVPVIKFSPIIPMVEEGDLKSSQ